MRRNNHNVAELFCLLHILANPVLIEISNTVGIGWFNSVCSIGIGKKGKCDSLAFDCTYRIPILLGGIGSSCNNALLFCPDFMRIINSLLIFIQTVIVCRIHDIKAGIRNIFSDIRRRVECRISTDTKRISANNGFLIDISKIRFLNILLYMRIHFRKIIFSIIHLTGSSIRLLIYHFMNQIISDSDKGYRCIFIFRILFRCFFFLIL